MLFFFINISSAAINAAETEQPLPLICARMNEGDSQPTMLAGNQNNPISAWEPVSLSLLDKICLYDFQKQKFYALGVEQGNLIFFPWNNRYKNFLPGSELYIDGSIATSFNEKRVPIYSLNNANLTDANDCLNHHANTWLIERFSALEVFASEQQEAFKIPANEAAIPAPIKNLDIMRVSRAI